MQQIQAIQATEARNRFFELLKLSYLQGQRFRVEKGGIPMVWILPVKEQELIDDDYSQQLLQIKGDWFSISDWKKIRKEIKQREN